MRLWRRVETCQEYLHAQRKGKATFFSPTDEWSLPAASTIKPEEREFVVDSRASMHMASRKDLDSADLETVRVSTSPTTVVTANGEVLTKEEPTLYVKGIGLIRDCNAFLRYTCSSLTWKTLRRSRG